MEDLILTYFPELTQRQREQFAALLPLYSEWNSKINVVSRKDIDNLYLHHVLHSLAISRVVKFPAGSAVLDVGTGGGFPGIPLAILFPEVSFVLCDSIGKKTLVARSVAESLGLNNVRVENARAESIDMKFDFVVSRAVTELKNFLPWIWNSLLAGKRDGIERGVLYLKGGELGEEISVAAGAMRIPAERIGINEISKWFKEPFFEGKMVLYIKR